jgi:outer membrane protein TolC
MKFIKFSVLLLLTSCAQNPEIVVKDIASSASFIAQGDAQVDTQWWRSFNNDDLSALVQQGLQDNLFLKAKDLRLKSTEIDSQIASGDLYPTLNLSSSASTSFDDFGDLSSASLGFSSSWELDLWGRIDANINKTYWNHQEQIAIYRGSANLVAGGITNAWLGVISEQEKQLVLAKQYKRTKVALQVISRRFEMGKTSITTIWQQQKLLKSIEVQQSRNHTDLFLYQQTLALWLSVPTSEIKINSNLALPLLPAFPKIGVPVEVLKYRPDIEQAYAKIKAANENLAAAISNQYPRITLRANYSTAKNSVKDLFDDWSGNLIASLAMPLFDSGERELVVKQRNLQLQALLMDYKQVWLKAISTVNQVLINEAQLLKITKNLEEQLALAERTEKLTSLQYLNGKTTYLNLLKAQESILSLERQIIDAEKRVIINRVLLYRELSHGDFSMNNKETEQNNNSQGNIS